MYNNSKNIIEISCIIASFLSRRRPLLNKVSIEKTINSLLYQTVIKEIIIINFIPYNNLFKSLSIHCLDKYKKENRIKVINVKPKIDYNYFNKSWLLNIGIKKSSHDIIMIHDIDMILDPKFSFTIKKYKYELLDENKKYIFFSRSYNCTPETNLDTFVYPKDYYHVIENLNLFLFGKYPNAFNPSKKRENINNNFKEWDMANSQIICRKNILLEAEGYDERLQIYGLEDIDLNIRLRSLGASFYCPELTLIHQYHSSYIDNEKKYGKNILTNSNIQKDILKEIKIIKEWGLMEKPALVNQTTAQIISKNNSVQIIKKTNLIGKTIFNNYYNNYKKNILKIRKENIRILIKEFDQYNINIIPISGTLLGIYREGDLILDDNDDDFLAKTEDHDIICRKIYPRLKKQGFIVIKTQLNNGLLGIMRKNQYIDISFYENIEKNKKIFGRILTYPIEKNLYPYYEKENLIPFYLENIKLLIPKDTKKILELWYGKTWNIPHKGSWKIKNGYFIWENDSPIEFYSNFNKI